MKMNLKSKFRGSLLGTGIGDSLGRTLESCRMVEQEKVKKLAEESETLRYTDDTQQMISLAESLVEKKGFDGEHFAERLVENFDPMRGYGPGSSQVIRNLEKGNDWDKPAQRLFGGEGSYGNGSSMRVAPAGLFCYDNLENLRTFVRDCSRVTHSHRLGIEGAILQSASVALATRKETSKKLDSRGFLEELFGFIKEKEFIDKLEKIKKLLSQNSSRKKVIQTLGNGVEAFNSVPTAVYSFLSHPEDFADAVTFAISLGGDADTIGAMTGAAAGAYHGEGKIPSDWKRKLEDREKLVGLADQLAKFKS
ncbi:hypothetical protein AKJ51_01995 [candidate division MSBL1 archaeon SCGC-AAA382A20]|uniref:ADP-ribosylglycohydrolase n=1 Tax=candidate division MSBL1 archaeon SCGC-AAA382A20 TaxID=1698280 RepID=A0A133VKX7_9EURY|nr:hypothetical protein AKJ51_01995 [candidate division MSBL1 archaeon SCGC-AAA382A20]